MADTFAFHVGDRVRVIRPGTVFHERVGTVLRDEVGGFRVRLDRLPEDIVAPYVTIPSDYLAHARQDAL